MTMMTVMAVMAMVSAACDGRSPLQRSGRHSRSTPAVARRLPLGPQQGDRQKAAAVKVRLRRLPAAALGAAAIAAALPTPAPQRGDRFQHVRLAAQLALLTVLLQLVPVLGLAGSARAHFS